MWEQWVPSGRSQNAERRSWGALEGRGAPRSWYLKLLYEARGHAGRSEPGSLGTWGVQALGSNENQSLTSNPSPAPSMLGDPWQAAAPSELQFPQMSNRRKLTEHARGLGTRGHLAGVTDSPALGLALPLLILGQPLRQIDSQRQFPRPSSGRWWGRPN